MAVLAVTGAAGLVLEGQFHPFGAESPRSERGPVTFLQALRVSSPLENSSPGGPWVLSQAWALNLHNGSGPFYSLAAKGGSAICPMAPAPSVPPAPASDFVDGTSPYWSLDFLGSNGSYLRVVVVSGLPQRLELIPPWSPCGFCPSPPSPFGCEKGVAANFQGDPGRLVDSSRALAAASSLMIPFLDATARVDGGFGLLLGSSPLNSSQPEADWSLFASSCPYDMALDSGMLRGNFWAEVGARNGTLMASDVTPPQNQSCAGGSTPLDQNLYLGTPYSSNIGDGFSYTFRILAVNNSLSVGSIAWSVDPSSGSSPAPAVQIVIVHGSVLDARGDSATQGWAWGNYAPLPPGGYFVIQSSVSLHGWELVIRGDPGQYADSIAVHFP